jgi:UDP-3-O-[3-hydroxymyristoyl] glucosamine N-acyltransferase
MGIPLYDTEVEETPVRVREIAEYLAGTFEGDGEVDITSAAQIDAAGANDIAFVGNRKAAEQVQSSAAGCLIVPFDFTNAYRRTVIRVQQPRTSFAEVVARLHPKSRPMPGIHPSAVIADTAEIEAGCSIGPHVSIGDQAYVGKDSIIGGGTRIGTRVVLGESCTLYPNVTIYDDVEIGNRCILHAGCVLGADGFGYVMVEGRYEKFPQVGRVTLGDDVEIGANACVDRAALGVTSIGDGSKLDNMVHIGHNCRIGRHVVIAAQTGLAGGVIVEDYATIGGQVGIGDQARIQSGAVLGSGCGILTSKIVRSGQVVWGTPARPLKEYLHQLANLARLDKLRAQVAELTRQIAELQRTDNVTPD